MGLGIGQGEGEGEGLKAEFTPYYTAGRRAQRAQCEKGEETRGDTWRVMFVLLVIACIVGLAMIVVGSLHAAPLQQEGEAWQRNCTVMDRCGCPGEPMMPWYLIIGGILTIGLVLVRLLLTGICQKCGGEFGRDNKSITCKLGQITCLSLYDILALVVTAMWLLAGTKFCLSLYQRVNYATHRPNNDTCDFGLFWFCVTLIIIGWIFLVLCMVFGLIWRFCKCASSLICCRPCRGKTLL